MSVLASNAKKSKGMNTILTLILALPFPNMVGFQY